MKKFMIFKELFSRSENAELAKLQFEMKNDSSEIIEFVIKIKE